jgi:hypothetical protein
MADARLCKRCKAEIPAERIDALPDTQVCVKCCQTALNGSEVEMHVIPGSSGKDGSIKKNYTSFTLQTKPKTIRPLDEQAPSE